MSVIFAGSLLAKLPGIRSLFGDRCSRGKVVECRVEREVKSLAELFPTCLFRRAENFA